MAPPSFLGQITNWSHALVEMIRAAVGLAPGAERPGAARASRSADACQSPRLSAAFFFFFSLVAVDTVRSLSASGGSTEVPNVGIREPIKNGSLDCILW